MLLLLKSSSNWELLNYSDFHLLITALAIAPFPDPLMPVPQNSVLFESIGTTIVQLAQAGAEQDSSQMLAHLTQPPEVPEGAIVALQRLIQLLQQLRLLHPRSFSAEPLPPKELVPYVMEEALDVVEALQMGTSRPAAASPPTALIRLDSLVTPILWAIARSAYPVMELLEGMRTCASLPGEPWISGVLRLVPLLEVTTPTQSWRFDLITGREPQNLITSNLQIQPEKTLCSDFSVDREVDPAIHFADQQLQNLLNQLSACNPALQTLFRGMAVDLLFPHTSWQPGHLQLRLDFEFVAQEIADFVPAFQAFQDNWVEAELLAGQEPENISISTADGYVATVPLAVIEMPVSLLEPSTLIRIAEVPLLNRLADVAHQQVMATAIAHINRQLQSPAAIESALAVIYTAAALEPLAAQVSQQNFSLLQPELLMDELVPKLLWQISRSSCALMQWIGGIPVKLLHPDRPWETGILRLLAVLALSTCDRTWYIDLATGRFIPNHSWQFHPEAVVLLGHASVSVGMPAQNPIPLRVETLLEQLLSPLHTHAPDVAMLQDAIAVEWLTSEQEWQPGQLALHWGFAWMPDIR